jgi:hypothetical protein
MSGTPGVIVTPFPAVTRATAETAAAAEHARLAVLASANWVPLNAAPGPVVGGDDS